MRNFKIEDNQADMLRSELESGADDSEKEFQQTLDKYYHDADEFEQKLIKQQRPSHLNISTLSQALSTKMLRLG